MPKNTKRISVIHYHSYPTNQYTNIHPRNDKAKRLLYIVTLLYLQNTEYRYDTIKNPFFYESYNHSLKDHI